MRKVFHILPEGESFSEFHGGAISRWVANVLREDRAGVVVAPGSDGSWQYPSSAVIVLAWLRAYRALQKLTKHRTPWVIRKYMLQCGFKPVVARLRRGDVVWVHNRPEFASALGGMVHRTGATLVLHMHNEHLVTAKRAIIDELHADRIVFVSEYLQRAAAALLREIPREVLYNGADGALFAAKKPRVVRKGDALQVLFASRLVWEKGPHVLAQALARLHAQGVPIEGTVVGGVEFGSARADGYVRELTRCAPPNLMFHPYCTGERLADLFRRADVFCLPSVWDDPFPLAPLEAMAAGLPVVATESGGIPEALAEGGGILVSRNSVEELAEALRRLAKDAALRERLSNEARSSFLRNFQWMHVRANYGWILERAGHAS